MVIINEVRKNLKQFGVKPGDLLIVAVSGGADSITLLHLLSELGKEYPFKLHAAHLNHSLRGEESDEDAEFVRKFSDALGIPSTVVKKDIASLARTMKKSKQEAARRVRYEVLEEILIKEKGDWIAMAHQAEDQAETFLMRLIRGSGSLGLSSIPRSRGAVIRPLFQITRGDIEAYLKEHRLAHREDSSNQLPLYLRNRVRHDLMPVLKKYNPNIVRALVHEADILFEEDRFLEEAVSEKLGELVDFAAATGPVLKIAPFLREPLALQRRILRRVLFRLRGDLLDLHFSHIQQLLDLAQTGDTGSALHLPARIEIYRCYGTLMFINPKRMPHKQGGATPLPVPGEASLPELKITFRASPVAGAPEKSAYPDDILFDLDQITLPLAVRTRRAGDFIRPVRLKGKKKKLQDIFVDLKTPGPLRDFIPLITGPDRILWGMGIGQDFKSSVSSETKRALRIEIERFP